VVLLLEFVRGLLATRGVSQLPHRRGN
jgi:hypothetical protein